METSTQQPPTGMNIPAPLMQQMAAALIKQLQGPASEYTPLGHVMQHMIAQQAAQLAAAQQQAAQQQAAQLAAQQVVAGVSPAMRLAATPFTTPEPGNFISRSNSNVSNSSSCGSLISRSNSNVSNSSCGSIISRSNSNVSNSSCGQRQCQQDFESAGKGFVKRRKPTAAEQKDDAKVLTNPLLRRLDAPCLAPHPDWKENPMFQFKYKRGGGRKKTPDLVRPYVRKEIRAIVRQAVITHLPRLQQMDPSMTFESLKSRYNDEAFRIIKKRRANHVQWWREDLYGSHKPLVYGGQLPAAALRFRKPRPLPEKILLRARRDTKRRLSLNSPAVNSSAVNSSTSLLETNNCVGCGVAINAANPSVGDTQRCLKCYRAVHAEPANKPTSPEPEPELGAAERARAEPEPGAAERARAEPEPEPGAAKRARAEPEPEPSPGAVKRVRADLTPLEEAMLHARNQPNTWHPVRGATRTPPGAETIRRGPRFIPGTRSIRCANPPGAATRARAEPGAAKRARTEPEPGAAKRARAEPEPEGLPELEPADVTNTTITTVKSNSSSVDFPPQACVSLCADGVPPAKCSECGLKLTKETANPKATWGKGKTLWCDKCWKPVYEKMIIENITDPDKRKAKLAEMQRRATQGETGGKSKKTGGKSKGPKTGGKKKCKWCGSTTHSRRSSLQCPQNKKFKKKASNEGGDGAGGDGAGGDVAGSSSGRLLVDLNECIGDALARAAEREDDGGEESQQPLNVEESQQPSGSETEDEEDPFNPLSPQDDPDYKPTVPAGAEPSAPRPTATRSCNRETTLVAPPKTKPKQGDNVLVNCGKKTFLAQLFKVEGEKYHVYYVGNSEEDVVTVDVLTKVPKEKCRTRVEYLGREFYSNKFDLLPGRWKIDKEVVDKNNFECIRLSGGTPPNCKATEEFDISYAMTKVREDEEYRRERGPRCKGRF